MEVTLRHKGTGTCHAVAIDPEETIASLTARLAPAYAPLRVVLPFASEAATAVAELEVSAGDVIDFEAERKVPSVEKSFAGLNLTSVEVSRGGEVCAVVDSKGLTMCDTKTWEVSYEKRFVVEDVGDGVFSEDGTLFAVIADSSVVVYNTASGTLITTLPYDPGASCSLAFHTTSLLARTADSLYHWSTETWERTDIEDMGCYGAFARCRTDTWLVTYGGDVTLGRYGSGETTRLATEGLGQGGCMGVNVSDDGRYAVVWLLGCTVLYEISTGSELLVFNDSFVRSGVTSCGHLFYVQHAGNLDIYRIGETAPFRRMKLGNYANDVAMYDDKLFIAFASGDLKVCGVDEVGLLV